MRADEGPVDDEVLESPCPACGRSGLRIRTLPLDLPFFGDAVQTTIACAECGFRHTDILLSKEGPPTRHELTVTSSEDLRARVVRSSSCTVRLHELGASMEPGPRSEAFVSNAEGVLRRFRDIYRFLERHADGRERRDAAAAGVREIDRMIEGRRAFTLVLEDPLGNSAILHDAVVSRPLTDREVRELQVGVTVLGSRRAGGSAPASP